MRNTPGRIIVGQAANYSDANLCGCCEGMHARTPVEIYNKPGLSSLAYRVGTYAQFKESMVVGLSDVELPALQDFTTREDDSFAIALLDGWATIADVLTFYQERIANESYLRTATERMSLFELSRLIGYRPRPGISANTFLAFTVEDTPASPGKVSIQLGTKVQSVPGPGEKRQVFETAESIEARPEWNAMRLRRIEAISCQMSSLVLEGTKTNLRPGDCLLVVHNSQDSPAQRITYKSLYTIRSINVDNEAKTTEAGIEFISSQPKPPTSGEPPATMPAGKVEDLPESRELNDEVVNGIVEKTWQEADLLMAARIKGWSLEALNSKIYECAKRPQLPDANGVFVFRQRSAVFGSNAPKQLKPILPAVLLIWLKSQEWPLEGDPNDPLFLDNAYNTIQSKSYVAVQKRGEPAKVLRVAQSSIHHRSAYGLSSKTTQLTFVSNEPWHDPFPDKATLKELRDVMVLFNSEALSCLGQRPPDTCLGGNRVILNGAYLGLGVVRVVIVQGERNDLKGVRASEVATLKEVRVVGGYTEVTFDRPLIHRYVASSVTINANVARASHGETVHEILGSGDFKQTNQRFALLQKPLTYVHTPETGEAESSLKVRINDVLWHEVPSFLEQKPQAHIFATRTDDTGRTIVEFSDGKAGARLPVGVENVQAEYRKGVGRNGLLRANSLSQLMTRPLGLKGVTNPLDTTDAEDPESLDEVRENAPSSLLTFDRAVSFQDYEDFARNYSGIAKAKANWFGDDFSRVVVLTVAGRYDRPVSEATVRTLAEALRKAGDPFTLVRVRPYRKVLFRIGGQLRIHSDYRPEAIVGKVRNKLCTNFGFDARALGQSVALSEIIAVIQGVEGVVSEQISEFSCVDEPASEARVHDLIDARDQTEKQPAQLLTLDESSLGRLEAAS